MAQLWLTYQEIADEFGGDPAHARDVVIAQCWPRKHSSDGETRVLMPADWTMKYILSVAHRIAMLDVAADGMSGALRSVFIPARMPELAVPTLAASPDAGGRVAR